MKGCDGHSLKTARKKDMNEFIIPSEIDHLTEAELRTRYFEIFNALARNQHAAQNCAQLIDALDKIQAALNTCRRKPSL